MPHCPHWKGVSEQSPHPGRWVALGDSPAWETCSFSPLPRVFGHVFTCSCGLTYLHFILRVMIQNVIMHFVASFGHWEPFPVGTCVPWTCSVSCGFLSTSLLPSPVNRPRLVSSLPPPESSHFSKGPGSRSLEPGVTLCSLKTSRAAFRHAGRSSHVGITSCPEPASGLPAGHLPSHVPAPRRRRLPGLGVQRSPAALDR